MTETTTETDEGAAAVEVPLAWGVTRTTDDVDPMQRGFYICGFRVADFPAVEAAHGTDSPPPTPMVMLHLAYVEGATVAEAAETASVIADVFNAAFPTISLRTEESTTPKEPKDD